MNRIATFAFVTAAALALAGCGKSDSANEAAQADNVEMPAEEAVNALDETATPAVDASAMATDPAASDAAAAAATGTPSATATPETKQ
jgi:predicted component of type VI protein secretion system